MLVLTINALYRLDCLGHKFAACEKAELLRSLFALAPLTTSKILCKSLGLPLAKFAQISITGLDCDN